MNSKHALKGSIISAVVMAALFAAAGIASADAVTPATMGNWQLVKDNDGSVLTATIDHGFVTGPGTPPIGTGSLHLTKTSADTFGIESTQFASTSLSSISSLSYSTYNASSTATSTPSLGFDVDSNSTDGITTDEGRLTFEPYFTQTVATGTWQTWNALSGAAASSTTTGNWWFSHPTLNGSTTSVCTQANPCTWAEVLASYPHAAIRSGGQLIIRTEGADSQAFDGNVDNLTVGITGSTTKTFDFDPIVASTTAACNGSTFDDFTLGSVNGQGGWSSTGSLDQAVVDNTFGFTAFGCKSLRISNATTSTLAAEQIFSPSLTNEAGETGAATSTFSGGTRQKHFEAQFSIASAATTTQPGLALAVSPDRGSGSRMSYLRFEDHTDGIHVFFEDVTNPGPTSTVSTFNEVEIAGGTATTTALDRTVPHVIKFSMDFVDGPSNDVVAISIDGTVVHTGTSWENYYRFDPQQAPSGNVVPTVDSLLFSEKDTAVAANAGKGFLIDLFSEANNPPAPVVTPTPTPTPVPIANGPIVGGGGGGGGPAAVALPYNGGAAPSGNTTTGGTPSGSTTGGGQVLGASTFNFTSNLTIGSKGTEVTELQKFLMAQGFSIPSLSTGAATYGYFGAQTRSALAKYQSAHSIAPAAGYFGPLTRASVNASAAPTTTDAARAALIATLTTQLNALLAKLNALIAARGGTQTTTTY